MTWNKKVKYCSHIGVGRCRCSNIHSHPKTVSSTF